MRSLRLDMVVVGALTSLLGGVTAPTARAIVPRVNGKIAFESLVSGNYEIYTMDSDGSSQVNLTNDPSSDYYPAWSPDGSRIAFSSNRAGCNHLYAMNADGSALTTLTTGTADDLTPSWSPDGTQVAFARDADCTDGYITYDIYVMNADGSGAVELTSYGAFTWNPAWSPDGKKIAFESGGPGYPIPDIWTINPDGSDPVDLTNSRGVDDRAPSWSPDGTKIAFGNDASGNNHVYTMNADGTDVNNITPTQISFNPSWSPDGAKIAFDDGSIYTMNADGTDITALPTTEASDPDWQPVASAPLGYRDVILADNPIMYWRLGETSGTTAYDETANHRDATYIKSPFLRLAGAIANDANTAVGFNGNDQYSGWAPTSSYSGSFTVEAWVKLRKVHLIETFFDTRTTTAEFSFDFKFDTLAGKMIHFDVGDGTQWLSNAGVPFDFRPHVYYYVAAVVTTTGATYYVNGTAIGSVTYSGTPLLFDPAHKVQIGTNTRYDDEWFHGKVDEVAVYDYALSADQIASHYAAGIGQ